ncbi:MAG: hypothetical protein NZ898_14440 [Myxococcota bacterium]|nr:hypothetical protein [Myxococcota bacterium]MDW8361651.1 hypothetical protein [Myxococcales bacterium]
MATDINALVRSRIDALVQEVQSLVRQAALEAVRAALVGPSPDSAAAKPVAAVRPAAPPVRRPVPPPRPAAPQTPKAAPAAPAAPKGKATILRSPLARKLLDYIRSNPGKRTEELARALNVPSARIKPFLRRYVALGLLRTLGTRRATRYVPT